MSGQRQRKSYYPAFYRLCFTTVKGLTWIDYPTLEIARRNQSPGSGSYILACWYTNGRTLDTEQVR